MNNVAARKNPSLASCFVVNSYAPKSLRNTDEFSEFLKSSIDCNVFGVELSTVYVSERVQIPAARFSGTATKTMNARSAIDARSLDMDRLIAQRLRENPTVWTKLAAFWRNG